MIKGGVDLTIFKPEPIHHSTNEKFIVLYSGAFSVAYDFEQVLKAAKSLKEDKAIEFILQGKGELIDQIRSMIRELDLKNVKVIDKILSREEVSRLLNEADVLLLPLRDFGKPYLGISSKLYEYQAVGKPIICCASGMPASYVLETKSGIVVEPGDYVTLAKSIRYLKEDHNAAIEMGQRGRVYVEENLSIERIGQSMKSLFEHIS